MTTEHKPHFAQDDFAALREALMKDGPGGRIWVKTEHHDLVNRIEEQFETLQSTVRELVDSMWTVTDGDDGPTFVSDEGLKYLVRKLQELDALLPGSNPASRQDT